jgi:hypothetical protein
MSTSVDTGLTPFNFIRKHFLQICFRKVAVRIAPALNLCIYCLLEKRIQQEKHAS